LAFKTSCFVIIFIYGHGNRYSYLYNGIWVTFFIIYNEMLHFGDYISIILFMVVRMRHTKAHTGNRRSHHALLEPRLSRCENCSHFHLRHRVCEHCGMYRGRTVIDVTSIAERKLARTRKKKEKSRA
jgi:large subunit ribosomal protein L32